MTGLSPQPSHSISLSFNLHKEALPPWSFIPTQSHLSSYSSAGSKPPHLAWLDYYLPQGQQTFPEKDQVVHILGFVAHMVTVTATQQGCPLERESSHRQDGSEWIWLCFNKIWLIDGEILISYNFPILQNIVCLCIFFPNRFKTWKLFPARAWPKTGSWLGLTCGPKSANAAGMASYVFLLSTTRQKTSELKIGS